MRLFHVPRGPQPYYRASMDKTPARPETREPAPEEASEGNSPTPVGAPSAKHYAKCEAQAQAAVVEEFRRRTAGAAGEVRPGPAAGVPFAVLAAGLGSKKLRTARRQQPTLLSINEIYGSNFFSI